MRRGGRGEEGNEEEPGGQRSGEERKNEKRHTWQQVLGFPGHLGGSGDIVEVVVSHRVEAATLVPALGGGLTLGGGDGVGDGVGVDDEPVSEAGGVGVGEARRTNGGEGYREAVLAVCYFLPVASGKEFCFDFSINIYSNPHNLVCLGGKVEGYRSIDRGGGRLVVVGDTHSSDTLSTGFPTCRQGGAHVQWHGDILRVCSE
jgi:hypothetical protein